MKPASIPRNIASVVSGLMPISNVAISGIAFMLCLSCATASPKLLSVTIIAGKMSFPIIPANVSSHPAANRPILPCFLMALMSIDTIRNTIAYAITSLML